MDDKLRVLAVDDSIVTLATIEQELRSEYEVITVNSGMRALRYIGMEKPDLILLDIQMMQKDGIQTLKDIRAMKNGVSIPVIMLTSKKDKDLVVKSSKLGVYDYVLKPFDAQDLKERIRRTLKKAGAIPVEESELYEDVKEIQDELRAGNEIGAMTTLNAVINYRIDKEVISRLQNIREKLLAGDLDAVYRMVERLSEMLERNPKHRRRAGWKDSPEVLQAWLVCILDALEDFDVESAAQMLEYFLGFDLPSMVGAVLRTAQKCLEEYDDGAAEELVRQAMEQLKG